MVGSSGIYTLNCKQNSQSIGCKTPSWKENLDLQPVFKGREKILDASLDLQNSLEIFVSNLLECCK